MIICTSLDMDADALYIQIARGQVARTEELDSWTLVDVDADGRPLGIEVIHPARTWPLQAFVDRYHVDEPLRRLLEPFVPSASSGLRHPYDLRGSDVGTTAVAVAL
jgi:uncharacterized protein YuzE